MIMKGAVRAVRILCRQSTISTSIAFTSAVRECSIDLTIQISLLADGELVFIELVSVGQLNTGMRYDDSFFNFQKLWYKTFFTFAGQSVS